MDNRLLIRLGLEMMESELIELASAVLQEGTLEHKKQLKDILRRSLVILEDTQTVSDVSKG